MRPLFATSGVVNAICLVILVLRFALFIPSFGMWFYIWQYDVNNTYEVVNMQPEHLHEVTRHMIRYMQGREDNLQIMTIVGGEARYFFSDIEIRHMIDVQDLFTAGNVLINTSIALFALTLAVFVIFGRDKIWHLLKGWQIVSVAVFSVFALLVFLIGINWHNAFVIFHEIFFNNDYWILNPRVDLLVNIVPYNFFITLSIVIGSFFAVGLGIIFTASTLLLRRSKKSSYYGR
ncbi:MAG: TIGR01906 family membrane protein [Defluviitaleaceae bacterium]|nr:TIGR01906 family membrane protein [Defluviitaleaceae bacterium]